jgi:hypothetical protein
VLLFRAPYKRGPAAATPALLVSATRLAWRRYRDLPTISWQAMKLRRTWRTREGAIGVSLAIQPLARTSWSVTVWQDEHAFERFLTSQHHVGLMRDFQPALSSSSSATWKIEHFRLREAWTRARDELNPERS